MQQEETQSIINIAVQGCFHGCADEVFGTVEHIQRVNDIKIDVLLICGDFQSFRNKHDMYNMACPRKYLQMGTFYKYYMGLKQAPCLTIFVSGNHEASNYMRELHFGGWVAPNIYYMGASNVINIKKGNTTLKLGGISGIFKAYDFNNSRLEKFPFDESTVRNAYHVKSIDVVKLMLYQQPIDIFLSHDWPSQIYLHGNTKELLQKKKFFAADIKNDKLGSPALKILLQQLKPQYWFAAHMHVKFEAQYKHSDNKSTKFLSLDKCIEGKEFLQVMGYSKNGLLFDDLDEVVDEKVELFYDQEWLSIVKASYKLLTIWDKIPKLYFYDRDLKDYRLCNPAKFDELLKEAQELLPNYKDKAIQIPNNFYQSAEPYDPKDPTNDLIVPQFVEMNKQTREYLQIFNEEGLELNGFVYWDPNTPRPEPQIPGGLVQIKEGEIQQEQHQQQQEQGIDEQNRDEDIQISQLPFL